jgi:hypothetical protein
MPLYKTREPKGGRVICCMFFWLDLSKSFYKYTGRWRAIWAVPNLVATEVPCMGELTFQAKNAAGRETCITSYRPEKVFRLLPDGSRVFQVAGGCVSPTQH